jgi:hypothetical protein
MRATRSARPTLKPTLYASHTNHVGLGHIVHEPLNGAQVALAHLRDLAKRLVPRSYLLLHLGVGACVSAYEDGRGREVRRREEGRGGERDLLLKITLLCALLLEQLLEANGMLRNVCRLDNAARHLQSRVLETAGKTREPELKLLDFLLLVLHTLTPHTNQTRRDAQWMTASRAVAAACKRRRERAACSYL